MNSAKAIIGIAIIILLGAGGFFFWSEYPRGIDQEVASGQTLSQDAIFGLVLSDESGNPRTLADYKGKNTIILTWATWCPYCARELKELARVKDEYREKIEVVAVNRGEAPESVRSHLEKNIIHPGVRYLSDPNDSFYKAIGGFSMPETIFIDKKSEVRFHKRGPMNTEELRRRAQDIFGI